jgi:hypothetical protein
LIRSLLVQLLLVSVLGYGNAWALDTRWLEDAGHPDAADVQGGSQGSARHSDHHCGHADAHLVGLWQSAGVAVTPVGQAFPPGPAPGLVVRSPDPPARPPRT